MKYFYFKKYTDSTFRFISKHVKRNSAFSLIFLLFAHVSFAQIFVKEGGSGSGDSWDNATGTIPTGSLAENTKIYIAAGNYNIAAETRLRENGILIQGGFPTNAQGTNVTGYNPILNITTLTRTGTGSNRKFYEGSSRSADVAKVMEVKGIRFTGAHDNGSLFYLSTGYGVYRFTDITAYDITSTNGVIYLTTFNGGSVTISNSNFHGNTATADGGVIYHSTENNNAKLIIKGSSFTNNKADHGGALYITSINDAADAVLIENSSFCSNTSNLYGGAIYQTSSRITITGSTFSNNVCPAGYYGGAIFCTTSQLTIDESSFYSNEGGSGGAIYSTTWYDGNINKLSNSVFYGNKATDNKASTGTHGGGALAINANSNAWDIQSSKFVANSVLASSFGGAISHYDAETTLSNCLFANNTKGGDASVLGSDIMNYDNSGGFRSIVNSKMQLVSASSYLNEASSTNATSYAFDSQTTFENTDIGGVVDPQFSCPINISFSAPLLTVPDFNVTYANVPVDGNVSTNDKSPTGTTYGTPVPAGTNPSGGGTITMNPDGTYTFTGTQPGVYKFEVPVCIPNGGTPCPTETLDITVLSKDVANPPVANPDYATGIGSTTGNGLPITSVVKANDKPNHEASTLGDPTITSPTPAANIGTIIVDNGNIVFTPAQGFFGEYVATYSICETPGGLCSTTTATFLVIAPGTDNTTAAGDDYISTPVGVSVSGNVKNNDTDPEGNSQTITPQTGVVVAGKGTFDLNSDGSYTFVPNAGFTGPVEFIYQTCDDGTPSACASATLHIMVMEVPDLTPSILNDGTALLKETTRDNLIVISNLGSPTTDVIRLNIPKMTPNFTVTIPANMTSADVFGGSTVENSNWTIVEQATRYVLTSKPGVTIPHNASIQIGIQVKAIGLSKSSGNLSVRIVFGTGGGELPASNNDDNNTYTVN